jgi:hypothetical protein
MSGKRIKQIVAGVLFSAFLFVSGAYGQDTCPVKLRVFSFIEGTIKTDPTGAALITLTEAGVEKSITATTAALSGEALFEDLPQKTYNISVVKEGFRKSTDTLTIDCSRAMVPLQGTEKIFNHFIVMWEGDPSKTVNYIKIDKLIETGGTRGEEKQISTAEKTKDQPAREFKIVEADSPRKVEPTDKAIISPPSSPAYKIGATEGIKLMSVSKGVLNGSALILAKPNYPPTAMAVGASGAVMVQVTIDEEGYVVAAQAISGHPLLRSGSAMAARASRFRATLLEGTPVNVSGIIVYNYQ